MTPPPVLTVAELTHQIKDCIEGNFPFVAVVGELSNCTRAGSGHVYLTLKDDSAQMRGVMWRGKASRVRFDLDDGLEVVAVGAVEVYAPRGTYQLVIEELIPQGVGPLELAFRQLRERLDAEGLFAPEHKQPLPRFPGRVALITSPTGAAVRDMLQVMTRRWPATDILIVPVPVQGDKAAPAIARAIAQVGGMSDIDVIIVGRGGGSLEDLWAFNEEAVARAIFECQIPIVSAVGHEIDVSISDLVADRRALTPSEAAELVVPSATEIQEHLIQQQRRMVRSLQEQSRGARMTLDNLATRRVLTRPLERLRDLETRLDDHEAQLQRVVRQQCRAATHRLAGLSAALDALSPLKVLGRGYSITTRQQDGHALRSAEDVASGETIITRLSDGEVTSQVQSSVPVVDPA